MESRIAQAHEQGEFDNLPGKGKPLQLDDDRLVPEEVRAAYKVLKNAGFVPPELDKVCNRHEISARATAPVMTGVAAIADRACRPGRLGIAPRYYGKVISKLMKPDSPKADDHY